jgi:RNA-directed DNA polymerase
LGTISLNTPTGVFSWSDVIWQKVEENVRKLQCRIAKAVKENKPRKVIKGLMRLLNKSLSARLLAVKKVVSNKGKKTAGVDGILLDTPTKKMQAVTWLKINANNYAAKPLKRVFIPKKLKNTKRQKISLKDLLKGIDSSSQWRPLGIPTQQDRCLQALHKLSLEPVAETSADRNSYAYRLIRSTKDAIQQVFAITGYKYSAVWILEGDIKGCFDNISHRWVLENIPLNKNILKQWLKYGYTYENHWFDSQSGTPQGGIISPVIANMVLDGLEKTINALKLPKCHLVRYADDFIITCQNKEGLINRVIPVIEEFFKERGLSLSKEKTKITHIEKGFDFLGFNVRKYKGKPLIKPSKKSVENLKYKIKTVFKGL